MNYNELLDREIDMLVATRAGGWQLTERSAYSPDGGRWARVLWDDGSEVWLPYYTRSFDDAIAAAQYLLATNKRAFEHLNSFTAISQFIAEVTPRTLCVLMLEALDAAAKETP